MPALFERKPKLHTCLFCSELVVSDDPLAMREHYRTHLIEVTDNNGQRAFMFRCPLCGPMDSAWGGGRPDPVGNGVSAIFGHLLFSHGVRVD